MQQHYNLTKFKRGDFYRLSNKIILNQTICQKDFSECSILQTNFLNCIFDSVGFPCTNCESLTFENCTLTSISFKKSELEAFRFRNCQLNGIDFDRSYLLEFDFIDCIVNYVSFSAEELTDLKFYNSQLHNVSFSGSLLDNVTIKNSTLKKIDFLGAESYKEISINGKLIPNPSPINDYQTFLKEVDYTSTNNDSQVLKLTMIFFTLVTSLTFSILNSNLFSLIWQ